MKNFRTEVNPQTDALRFQHGDPVITLGSCFATSIGKRLFDSKFNILLNPFGTLYNPVSIHKALHYAMTNESPLPSTYLHSEGRWRNFDFHSSLSGTTQSQAEKTISDVIGTSHHFLRDAKVLIVTYGTAKVYERADSGEPVANCHKLPESNFKSHLMAPEQIVQSFELLYSELKKWNPRLSVLLTVSPIRHLKNTIEADSASKASLRWACHEISNRYPDVGYFPAFEIMMDDLRDYRFYARDMIHPSPEAVDYIWEKFAGIYLDAATRILVTQWEELSQAIRHRPFHPEGEAHQKFLFNTLRKLEELNAMIPVVDEITLIRNQILKTS